MDKKGIRKLRLLLNAEPFGFGPTAAIAAFFPHLREHFDHIGYIGNSHTTDLQENLPYDAIHTEVYDSDSIQQIMADYDVFLTAADFVMAKHAKQMGLKVCIYDPLLWYWPELPAIAQEADLYLAQGFAGVDEKAESVEQAQIVAPIVPDAIPQRSPQHVLINMGGLQNPFWSLEVTTQYAQKVLDSVLPQLDGEHVIVAVSQAIADQLKGVEAKPYSRNEMLQLLVQSKYAFMTPGLGNIYDAAHFDLPTAWLPPANDSQGQQLDLIRAADMCDAHLDWGYIHYQDLQVEVLAQISLAVENINSQQLGESSAVCVEQLKSINHSKANKLTEAFGRGGAAEVAAHVVELCLQMEMD